MACYGIHLIKISPQLHSCDIYRVVKRLSKFWNGQCTGLRRGCHSSYAGRIAAWSNARAQFSPSPTLRRSLVKDLDRYQILLIITAASCTLLHEMEFVQKRKIHRFDQTGVTEAVWRSLLRNVKNGKTSRTGKQLQPLSKANRKKYSIL